MNKKIRQYIGLIAAVFSYYIIHEGAHLIIALALGVFKEVRFMGVGVQIAVENNKLTDTQIGVFCLGGVLATLVCGYMLVFLCERLCDLKSQVMRAIAWYISLTMLLLDPIYLSILCGFVGGGDMKGIALLCPELLARILFAGIGIINAIIVYRCLLPKYAESFRR